MKPAMSAVLDGLRSLSSSIGIEGALLSAGTGALAVAAGFFHPAGPWAVIGCVALVLGFAVAWRSA